MPFDTFCEDILLKILSLCDVYTALSVSAINTRLRPVALAKQLWLSLVDDMAFRGVLNVPPAEVPEGYSTADIVAHIKRLVIGPDSWLPRSPTGPTLHRWLWFNIGADADALVDFRLLPGDRYVVIRAEEKLCIYEVGTGRRIWEHIAVFGATTWSVDLLPGGSIAHVLLLPIIYTGGPCDISVHEVDLISGQCNEIFSFDLPTDLERWMANILGDFLLFALEPEEFGQIIFLLVDWRAEKYVVLNYPGRQEFLVQATLVPGYIVATYGLSAPPHQQMVAVMGLEHLASHWASLDELSLDNQLSSHCIPFARHEALMYENRPLCNTIENFNLSVFSSALHKGDHEIVIYACENHAQKPTGKPSTYAAQMRRIIRRRRSAPQLPQPEARVMLLTYRLSPPEAPGNPYGWRLISALPGAPDLDVRLSYAGYCLNAGQWRSDVVNAFVDARRERAGDVSVPTRWVMGADPRWERFRLCPSGAVIAQMASSVILCYYK